MCGLPKKLGNSMPMSMIQVTEQNMTVFRMENSFACML
jgi:hypothetical protein